MELPIEIYQVIFEHIHSKDFATHTALYRTCKLFHEVYRSNKRLLDMACKRLIAVFQRGIYQYSGLGWRKLLALNGESIDGVCSDSHGNIWIVDWDCRFSCYDPTTNTLTKHAIFRMESSSRVSMVIDQHDVMWLLAMNRTELHKYDLNRRFGWRQVDVPRRYMEADSIGVSTDDGVWLLERSFYGACTARALLHTTPAAFTLQIPFFHVDCGYCTHHGYIVVAGGKKHERDAVAFGADLPSYERALPQSTIPVQQLGQLNVGRANPVLVSVGGRVLALGGRTAQHTADGTGTHVVESMRLSEAIWRIEESMELPFDDTICGAVLL
eukprot:TRINITY_DN14537_c0_g1_i1.p2 TRINITY_DN14537_c0_g1~~TRINITY_DN14537_c0_g1_i1.p2  ORF type:complete len:326 (-),score=54.56 TRINITY_DN14537_c0_g1_i1:1718-2695(-)